MSFLILVINDSIALTPLVVFFIFKTFITFVLFYKIKCDDTQIGCTTYDFRKVYIMCLYTQRETIVASQILFEHE